MAKAKFCTECGAPLPDGAKFCTGCGARIPADEQPARQAASQPQKEAAPVCASCGQPLVPAARFCPWCSAKLEEPASAASAQPFARAPAQPAVGGQQPFMQAPAQQFTQPSAQPANSGQTPFAQPGAAPSIGTLPLYAQPSYKKPINTQPAVKQPLYGQPAVGQPLYGQPPVQQQAYGQPAVQQPVGQPLYGQPAVQQPVGQPAYAQPVYNQSAYAQPVVKQKKPFNFTLLFLPIWIALIVFGALTIPENLKILEIPKNTVDENVLSEEQESQYAAIAEALKNGEPLRVRDPMAEEYAREREINHYNYGWLDGGERED